MLGNTEDKKQEFWGDLEKTEKGQEPCPFGMCPCLKELTCTLRTSKGCFVFGVMVTIGEEWAVVGTDFAEEWISIPHSQDLRSNIWNPPNMDSAEWILLPRVKTWCHPGSWRNAPCKNAMVPLPWAAELQGLGCSCCPSHAPSRKPQTQLKEFLESQWVVGKITQLISKLQS